VVARDVVPDGDEEDAGRFGDAKVGGVDEFFVD
jgi:hypothetical protein